ncbi:TonB-dependent receptor plug domain-containing protein [Thiomicrorhabdus indica]|uniref:TonB-dependent receptor plug domain-containing protein n=1 Tax=Thiomicrorhabdus indica TaxID=2267253 RepID=UPI002AA69133|nr:TonB-dependent receptor [Thiomicrorhabdus indica]
MKLNKLTLAITTALFTTTSLANTQLNDIVVSANKTEQSIKQITSNINVITAEDIEAKHYTTLTQVLNTVPGISFTSNGGLGKITSLYLRGFDSKRTLVVIDGIRYNDPSSSSGAPFEHIMLADIERIEVIKGPQSGIWGADASAGVINIITKTAKNGFAGNANVESGSYNTQKASGTIKYGSKAFDVSLSVSNIDSDGYTAYSPAFDVIDQYEEDGYRNTTVNAKLGVNLTDKDRIQIIHNEVNSSTDLDSYQAPDSDTTYGDNEYKQSKIEYTHQAPTFDLSLSHQRSLSNSEYGSPSYSDPSTLSVSEYDGQVNETQGIINWQYSPQQMLSAGASITQFEHKNTIDKDYSSKSVFMNHSHSFGKTVFNESIRHDNYDEFNNKTTYKLGVKHPVSDDLTLSANYGTAYNVPTLSQLYHPSWGNADIQAETTKGWDISAQYQSVSVTYFNNKITDMIDYDYSTYTYGNLKGTTRIKGVETEWKHSFSDVDLALNHTRLWTEDPQGEELARRPKDQIGFDMTWFASSQWGINLNGQYIGERSESNATDYYALFNSVINYQANSQTQIHLKIDNLFDKYYQVVDGYATAERSAYLGLNYQF